jgi:hypothetical protein
MVVSASLKRREMDDRGAGRWPMELFSAGGKASLRRVHDRARRARHPPDVADATDPHRRVERGGRLMAGSTSKPARQGAGWRPTALSAGVDATGRFPERTKADALRTRMGARLQAGQPTDR